MTLDQITPKKSGKVVKVNAGGLLGQRLLDLGVLPGLVIRVLRNAPLKDPMEVEVEGTLLSIRKDEARHVEVEPL
ncbi:MAG: ferrous iron transport protein A [Deltaproteobacteria bacterium]|nr:ferrous iron transport protein A [Deltaproteobacteria bacterium]